MKRLIASLMIVASLAGCQADPGQAPNDGTLGYQPGDGSVSVIEASKRHDAPELRGETLDGQQLALSDFVGQIVVLNVWGSWCPPCRKEAPELKKASEQLPEVQFIGINTRDLDPAPARAFVRSFGVDFPHLYDPDGALLLGFGELPPAAIPSTLVIDEQGRVAARILGETTAATFVGVVEQVQEGQ